ncbi:DUF928 domain-containing protein [Coleofasciculus sp. E1-EBD-02]|uniref:DUF928 domain-containing protein n=1 Tax=Coleofasciculus sp. E1-EBD-02 TaxID=3068481 RepID=UPI0032F6589E
MKKLLFGLKTFSLMVFWGLVMSASTRASAGFKPSSSNQENRTFSETLVAGHKGLQFKRWRSQETRRLSGGMARCAGKAQVNLTPLLPQLPTPDKIPVELTVEANPTFLVYVGESKFPVKEAQFTLLNGKGDRVIYEKAISLQDKVPGFVRISLPETTQIDSEQDLLEVDQTYNWYFTIPYDPNDGSLDPTIQGVVKRIAKEESLVQELAKTPEMNHPKVYADYGIWTETVSSLAQLRERYPDNPQLEADWIDLLESVGLDNRVPEYSVNRSES